MLDQTLVQLDLLRSILVAVGDAEQVPEESHALFLERFDELRASLPIEPIESQYLGQDLLCQVIQRYPQIAHLVPRDLLWYFAGDCLPCCAPLLQISATHSCRRTGSFWSTVPC